MDRPVRRCAATDLILVSRRRGGGALDGSVSLGDNRVAITIAEPYQQATRTTLHV
ncbi:MAG: hypothetical protein WBA67_04520 [Jannaschia sp.]